ncbi:CS19 fimbria chaperone CsdB [Escherichia coli]|uniref:CsbB n=1 Tax=Escherichia coli TaxID=562 RepID=Q848J8_ECOLX|nr:CS19 fimbria chaperone CsdB [Escherichia coli]AAO60095.1 CsbB [Escherichia coli]HAH3618260.1 CS19 fimbria chaperone CsdB [Escherichia coli]HBA6602653.1 CS19 fimbria chaperone CsdB [Escherichia coli]
MRKLFLSLLMIPFVTKANFMVYPISKEIKGASSEIIRIYSKSKDTQYIKVYAKKVVGPGTKDEYEIDAPNWEGALVVTPARVILPSGSNKSVRLTQLNAPTTEEVYRVYFESVKPEAQENSSGNKTLKTDLSVNVIYAALIRILPINIKTNASVSISPSNNILIKNTGNVRLGIMNVFFCKSSSINDDCVKKSYNKNVYPGYLLDTMIYNDGYSHLFLDTKDESSNKTDNLIQVPIT